MFRKTKVSVVLALCCTVGGAGLAGCEKASDVAEASAAATSSSAIGSSSITWGTCPAPPAGIKLDPQQTCGTLKVPLDYRHPHGKQITIAVSRIPATDPAKKRGILLLNPGGPGAEGLDMPSTFGETASKSVLADYDRIGFDPRGVGHSSPVSCDLTAAEVTPPYPYPAADGSITQNVTLARSAAASCAAKSGSVLPFITTANTARDMDRIRQALGQRKLSYYGTSYGTYLGAVYASLFPQHTDRLVLDSAVDPTKVWYGLFQQQSSGIAIRFPDAASYVADHSAQVKFGSTTAAVTSSYLELAAHLDARSATVPGASTKLTGNIFRFLTTQLLFADANIPTLAQLWQATADLVAGHATSQETGFLQQLLAVVNPSAGSSPGVPADNSVAAAYAVACDDASWPRNPQTYATNVTKDRQAFPLSAGEPANVWPCAFWPTNPVEAPVTVTSHGPRNILILQNQRDPAAPLVSGQGMHKALGARSVLVTVDAGGHVVYGMQGPKACSTTVTDTFLVNGTLPKHDVQCPAP